MNFEFKFELDGIDWAEVATDISRDNMLNQHVQASFGFDALARCNFVKCSTNHSNGSSNFFLNNRSASQVQQDQ